MAMQVSIQTIALGALFSLTGTAVRAQPNAPEAPAPVNAVAAPQLPPMDLSLHPATAQPPLPIAPAPHPATALPPTSVDLALQSASEEVKRVARWVLASRDNAGLPFLLVDKVNAQVLAFNGTGQLQGMTPALLGMARGDRLLAPNDAPMSAMPPQVRITPAGRFVSKLALDSLGKELLVLDYDASISLHAVVKGTPEEARAERLRSATAQDNRISFGCINVPAAFYSTIVSPAFTRTKGIVYVLPETSPASALFGFQPAGAAVAGAQQGSTALDAPAARPVLAQPVAQPAPAGPGTVPVAR